MIIFAKRLKELRKLNNLTQAAMAGILGLTERHYQRMEYGQVVPNAITLVILADYFGVTTDYLLGRG